MFTVSVVTMELIYFTVSNNSCELIHVSLVLPSCRNKSISLYNKSMDWLPHAATPDQIWLSQLSDY